MSAYGVLPPDLPATFDVARYAIAIGVLVIMLLAIHSILPARRMREVSLWPGILLTIVLWLTAASLFSLYLSHFNSYAITYGSLGGIIIALIFFCLTGIVFLLGGQFNAALWRHHNGAFDVE